MSRRSAVNTLGHVALALPLALVGFFALFTTFRDWDDEGYFALSLRAFVDGKPLYDDVYTQYGPFYYEVVGGLGAAFGIPFTTDWARYLTLGAWTGAALLVGAVVTMLSGRLVLGLSAQMVAFATCGVLVNTPLHPTGLILLMLGVAAAGVVALDSGRDRLAAVGIGVATAAIVLTKPNVGGFLVIGLTASCAIALARTDTRRTVTAVAVTVGAAAIPVVLMWDRVALYSTRAFLATLVASLVAIGVHAALTGPHGARVDVLSLVRLGSASAGVTAGCVLAIVLVHGTSLEGLLRGLVLEPLALSDAYYVPIEVPFGSAALALALSVVGILAPLVGRRFESRAVVALVAIALIVALAGSIALLAEHAGLLVGIKIEGRGALDALVGAGGAPWLLFGGAAAAAGLAGFAAPRPRWLPVAAGLARIAVGLAGWLALAGESELEGLMLPLSVAWLALVAPAGVQLSERGRFSRLVLVMVAVLQTAMVYPVGGSQAQLAVLLLVVTLGIVVSDGLVELRDAAGPSTARRMGISVAAVAVATVSLARPIVVEGWREGRVVYRSSAPLAVPGSSRLRLEPELAADLRALVGDVEIRCSALIGYPGLGSLHLWSGIDPVTELNPGHWMELLDTSEQQRIVDALAARPRRCAVWNETVYRHWMRGRPAAEGPLVDYVDGFEPVARYGRYEVRVDGSPEGGS